MLLRSLTSLLRLLPLGIGYRLSERLADLAYIFLGRSRTRALKNLKMAFGKEKGESELEGITRELFRNYGRNMAEVAHTNDPKKLFSKLNIQIQGEENLVQAFEKGKGLVFATAHFGNWELMAAYMVHKGYPVNVIARPMRDKRLDELVNGMRKVAGVSVIKRGKAGMELFRCLKRNEGLGVLVDLDTNGPGMFVDFFGIPAYTQTGPVSLATRSNAVLLMGLIHREGPFSHRIDIYPALELGPGLSEEEKIRQALRILNKTLEEEIRAHPQQWAWMHRRWRRKPDGSKLRNRERAGETVSPNALEQRIETVTHRS